MKELHPNKCLPPELIVQSVDDILYRIGLSFDSIRDRPKRKLIDHPLIAFIVVLIFMAERLITLIVSEENEQILRILGDVGHFIGFRFNLGTVFVIFSVLPLSSQIFYYINHRNGIKPTFLRVFQMMAGSVRPISLGLTEEKEIKKLLKTTKRLNIILRFNNDQVLPILCILFVFSFYLFYCETYETVIYGIPNTVLFIFWGRYYWNSCNFQFMCFYIICSYLKLKINALNERLIEMKRRKRFIRIRETLQSFDSLYSEINEYNTTFWSKFLAVFWLTFGSLITTTLYIIIFLPMPFPILFVFVYVLVILIQIFLFVIFTASSVTYCANNSYDILNSLYISYVRQNLVPVKINTCFMVRLIDIVQEFYSQFSSSCKIL